MMREILKPGSKYTEDEEWYNRMDALEALWLAKIADSRLEYLQYYVQLNRIKSGSESSSHISFSENHPGPACHASILIKGDSS